MKSRPTEMFTVEVSAVGGYGGLVTGFGMFASNGKPLSSAEWPTLCGTIGSENLMMKEPVDALEFGLNGSVGSRVSDAIDTTNGGRTSVVTPMVKLHVASTETLLTSFTSTRTVSIVDGDT